MRLMKCVLALLACAAVSGAVDRVPVAPPVMDGIAINLGTPASPTSLIYMTAEGDYCVAVRVEYVAAGARQVSVAVFDEDVASWRWATETASGNASVNVATGQGTLTFVYVIDGDKPWAKDIWNRVFDEAAVQATLMDGNTPKASDSQTVRRP